MKMKGVCNSAIASCRCRCRFLLIQIAYVVVTIRVVDANEFPAEFASELFSFLVRRGIGNIAGQVDVSMSKCTLMAYNSDHISTGAYFS